MAPLLVHERPVKHAAVTGLTLQTRTLRLRLGCRARRRRMGEACAQAIYVMIVVIFPCGKTASIDDVNHAIASADPPLDPLPTKWQESKPNEKQKESERRLVDSDHTSHHVFACIHNHRASGQRVRTAVMA